MKTSSIIHHPSSLLLLTSYLLLLTSAAAVQQKWTCETSRVEPVYFNAYHGETLKLDAKLLSNGRPVTNVTTASFLWQTNGMGSAWWQTNATIVAGHVKATFTPAMDPGASSVTFFFQVTDQDGSNYRPSGKLYLVKALGDNPTFPDIPPPGGTIDFSRLTLVNAPWATLEAAQSAIVTGLNQALSAVANESNRAERTYAKLSDIPAVPSITGLATTGQVAAAKAEAQAAAESTAAATYQPLAGMADYAKLTDIPAVPSIAGLATTGQVAAAKAEAQAAAESTAAATYQPLSGMADYAKLTDIPQVPSIAGLATTGEVAAAKAEAQAAAESTAAATYQPLSGMADYAKLTDIPQVPSISGLATTGEVAAAKAEAQAAAESTAAATYQPLAGMADYAQKHEVPEIGLTNRTLTINGNSVTIPYPGEAGRTISDGTNAIDAAGNVYTNNVLVDRLARVSQLGSGKADEFTPWVAVDYTGDNPPQITQPEFDGVKWIWRGDYGSDSYWVAEGGIYDTELVFMGMVGFSGFITATRQRVLRTGYIPPAISNSTTRIDADLTVTENGYDWTPSYVSGPEVEGSDKYVIYGYVMEYWEGEQYVWREGRGWVYSNQITMNGDNTNPDATELTFPDGTKTYRRRTVTTKLATTNELATAISPVSNKADDALAAANDANVWSSATHAFMTGGRTNCWWSGTNYVFGADAATRHKFVWEDGMDAATVPCSMALYEIRDGVRECVWDQKNWTSWYWEFKARQMEVAIQERIDSLGNVVTNDAMYAWAKRYASDGVRNPDPSTTCIDTPTVTLSPGMRWETVATVSGASYWTIVGDGAVIGGSGTNATLQIRDFEGNEIMTVTKGEHRLAWLERGEIVGQMTDAQGRVCFDMLADAQPTGYFSTTLDSSDFVVETSDDCPASYEWEDIGGGKWRVHFTLKPGIQANSCFAKFMVEIEGQTIIRYNAGQEIQGGLIYNGVKIAPDVSGSPAVGTVIQWKVVH